MVNGGMQADSVKLREDIRGLCGALLSGLDSALEEKLFGVYVYGAVAFPDPVPTGDIDFHVILRERLSDEERSAVNELHAALAREFPPLGAELDGYYILLDEARETSPPTHQLRIDIVDGSWALHREHIRAGRCIVLRGPDPKEVYPAASWPELEEALCGELRYVEEHLGVYPDYCFLNLCRLMYSFETRDVVFSKAGAADWAWDAFPQWRRHIELAMKSYARQATPEDREFMMAEMESFYRFARAHIEASRSSRGASQPLRRTGEGTRG
jgi:hypothetical protein